MEYEIIHRTTYLYRTPVSFSQHMLHLEPRELSNQKVLESKIEIEPEASTIAPREDYYGNKTTFVDIDSPHSELSIISRSKVNVEPPELPESTPPWEAVREAMESRELTPEAEAGEFLFESPYIPIESAFRDFATAAFTPKRPILECMVDLTSRIYTNFKFDSRATNIATPLTEVYRNRRGVCQDFAHFAIACLRLLQLPARYVSGYLETVPPPGKQRLAGADASHAWFSFWCPGHGWIDADPTNNVLPGSRHITIGWGRDFSDVSPVRGVVIGGADHRLSVGVDVIPASTGSD